MATDALNISSGSVVRIATPEAQALYEKDVV